MDSVTEDSCFALHVATLLEIHPECYQLARQTGVFPRKGAKTQRKILHFASFFTALRLCRKDQVNFRNISACIAAISSASTFARRSYVSNPLISCSMSV